MLLTECPRDAMQGWPQWIPTKQKIDYLNALLQVGFDVLDCGSFVSPKAIPQMKDTAEVLSGLARGASQTKISVIVANRKGAEQALQHPAVDILGYPFSISETFQHRNTNKTQEEAYQQVSEILEEVKQCGKQLRLYFSMAFGNPYGEIWQAKEVLQWAERFCNIGITEILLSDTTGVATEAQISLLFPQLMSRFPQVAFGAHFHHPYEEAMPKITAAYNAGCRSFDTAIKGIGGCPMAKEDLVGNMPTEQMINFLMKKNLPHRLHLLHFERAYNEAKKVFQF